MPCCAGRDGPTIGSRQCHAPSSEVTSEFPGGPVRSAVVKGLRPLQTGLVRLVGSFLQLGLSLLLVHLSGAALLGRFLFFVAIANLFTALGGGMPNLMLRYASAGAAGVNSEVGWLWRYTIELSL